MLDIDTSGVQEQALLLRNGVGAIPAYNKQGVDSIEGTG
jgi:hypothetical protein